MVLKDDAVLDIPAKASVRVMLKPANVTKVIAGPYKGTAKDYAPTTISTAAKKGAPPSSYGGSVGAKPPK